MPIGEPMVSLRNAIIKKYKCAIYEVPDIIKLAKRNGVFIYSVAGIEMATESDIEWFFSKIDSGELVSPNPNIKFPVIVKKTVILEEIPMDQRKHLKVKP
jgi:hypothetical protein